MLTPNFCKTSEDPDFEETDLFPCLAILIPHAEARIADAVDIFKVFFLSPPVPQVSNIFPLLFIFLLFVLYTFTAANSSLSVTPFNDNATKKAAVSIEEFLLDIINLNALFASIRERSFLL